MSILFLMKMLWYNAIPLAVGAIPLAVGAIPLEVGAIPLAVGAIPLEVVAIPLAAGLVGGGVSRFVHRGLLPLKNTLM
jgi:hypothetical protein